MALFISLFDNYMSFPYKCMVRRVGMVGGWGGVGKRVGERYGRVGARLCRAGVGEDGKG